MIQFDGLGKRYGAFEALQPLDLVVSRGELFGFLGPNGAGKTTTIRMMMGILVPTAGRVRIAGLDCQAQAVQVKRHVGYLPDNPMFYDFLRGREILEFVAEMHGYPRREAEQRAARSLDEFGLEEVTEEFAANYSMGMKKRLGLACAMIHDPDVLILDEPTNGLDPRASRDVQERLKAMAERGKTVFVSTHLLDMAERLCTSMAIIHRGELVGKGTFAELQQRAGEGRSLEELFLKMTDETATIPQASFADQ